LIVSLLASIFQYTFVGNDQSLPQVLNERPFYLIPRTSLENSQRVTHTMRDKEEAKAASNIQKTFRSFSVRLHLANAGVAHFTTPTQWHWQDRDKEVAAQLASSEFHKRRVRERIDCIEKYNRTARLVEIGSDRQIEDVKNLRAPLEQKLKDIPLLISSEMQVFQVDSLTKNNFDGDAVGRYKISGLKIARLKSKTANLEAKFRAIEEYLVVLRTLLTKSCMVAKYLSSFFKDLIDGIGPIKTVQDFINTTLSENNVEGDEKRYFVSWMQTEYKMLTIRLISYDSTQESVIEKEYDRLTNELEALCSSSNLFLKKTNCIDYIESWEAEQLASDISLANEEGHPDESLKHIDRSDMILTKVRYIRKMILPRVDAELNSVYVQQEKEIMNKAVWAEIERYASNGTTERLESRTSAVSKKSVSIKKFEVDEWMELFDTCPWLKNQAVDARRVSVLRDEKWNKLVSRNNSLDVLKARLKYDQDKALLIQKEIKRWTDESNLPTKNLSKREQLVSTAQKLHNIVYKFQLTEKERLNFINHEDMLLKEDFLKFNSENVETGELMKLPLMARDNFGELLLRSDESTRLTKFTNNTPCMTILNRIIRFCCVDSKKSKYTQGQNPQSIHEYTSRRREYLLSTKQCDHSGPPNIDNTLDWDYDEIFPSINALPTQPSRSKYALSSLANYVRSRSKYVKSSFFSKSSHLFQLPRNDPELRTMVTTVKSIMTRQNKTAAAVSSIAFTVGKKETENFCCKNMANKELGFPFYQNRLEIGKHTQVVVWVQTTMHKELFITDITFGHTDPRHQEFQMLTKLGFQVICHDSICGGVWVKRDNNNRTAVSHITISYNKKDRDTLGKDFVMVPVCLSKYELAKANLWITHMEWQSLNKAANLTQMRQQHAIYEKMLSRYPVDQILKGIVQELERRLEVEHRKQGQLIQCSKSDHVQHLVNFVALDDKDLAKLKAIYITIDKDKDGFISTNELMNFIQGPTALATFLTSAIILSLNSTDLDNKSLTFGETMVGLSTFAMFSKVEVVKFIFYTYNKAENGCIANSDYFLLLKTLHHKEKWIALRALREINLPNGGYITFDLFQNFDERFPSLLFPIFKLQGDIRQKFMGTKWWENKLRKFEVAKDIATRELSI